MTVPSKVEPLIQEGSVSPYLLQSIRSLDEVRKEIEAKRLADSDSKYFFDTTVTMVTSQMLGVFREDPMVRSEFLTMIGNPRHAI